MTWGYDSVSLSNPSVEQCQEVISKLKDNHQYRSIHLSYSSPDIVQLLVPPLLKIGTIEYLRIHHLHTPLTHDAVLSFSSSLSTNKSLGMLLITHGSINDDGVITLVESLKPNDTLNSLFLFHNSGITSASAQSLAKLLLTNHTLSNLRLDIRHGLTCSALPYFEQIKDRLRFVN